MVPTNTPSFRCHCLREFLVNVSAILPAPGNPFAKLQQGTVPPVLNKNVTLSGAPGRKGFGSAVIDSMAARTLGAEVQLDYAPLGLVWRLTCSAANALETDG